MLINSTSTTLKILQLIIFVLNAIFYHISFLLGRIQFWSFSREAERPSKVQLFDILNMTQRGIEPETLAPLTDLLRQLSYRMGTRGAPYW